MANQHIAIVVQGLIDKGDSIGYDAVFEHALLSEMFGKDHVSIFCERVDRNLHKDLPVRSIEDFWAYAEENPSAIIVYHYCDGWAVFDDYVMNADRQIVVRWHNNTPPWFYGASHRRSVERTVRGFRTIVDFTRNPKVSFWVNSNFTLDQLRAVGSDSATGSVVFPGSRFLSAERTTMAAQSNSEIAVRDDRPLRLLFVSRVVAHKGHFHVIEFASYLSKALARNVTVTFLGRDDPSSGLKLRLQRMAADFGVDVLLEGEVSNEDLHAAYLAADLFICLSEHEGFGMPVFEAMRLGVPVICLGRTALRELMQAHPFTLDELDYVRAAAMIRALDDDAVRDSVLSVQGDILETYTRQVVVDQLAAALEGVSGHWRRDAVLPDAGTLAGAQFVRSRIDAEVDAGVDGGAWPDGGFARLPREYGENYVTLYDIEAYEMLLSAGDLLGSLPEKKPGGDFALISHQEFMSPTGKRLEEGIAFVGKAVPGRAHLIYGPYARFTRGFFSVDFELEAEQSGDPDVVLNLEVAAEGEDPIASRTVTVAQAQAQAEGGLRLLFPVGLENTIMEFRISVKVGGNCNFLFSGVTIRNQRQSLVNLPEVPMPRQRAGWRKLVAVKDESWRLSSSAMAHFRRGDEARDRAWWNDATSAYEAGLSIEPKAFAYLVQLGNCSKEAGYWDRSEEAFLKALELRPDDRDANLQLGRLYLCKGDQQAANFRFLKAVRLERAAAEAMQELARTGFAIEALPDLFV